MSVAEKNFEIQSLIEKHVNQFEGIGLRNGSLEKVYSVFDSFARQLIDFYDKKPVQNSNIQTDDFQARLNRISDNPIRAFVDKYKGIANSISDIFFMLDNNLKFTFLTPSVEQILEYRYTELIGKGFDVLVPQWSGNTLKKNLENVLKKKPDIKEPHKFNVQLSGKYGKLIWYEVSITGIYNSFGEVQGYNGVCHDITEQLKYEEALRQAKNKAEQSDKLKSVFLANMSHEIRTPLNGIIGFSTMLNNKNLPESKKEKYSHYILSSSRQLLSLINDIIDISKIEAGQLSIFKTRVDLIRLFNELKEITDIERKRLERGSVELKMILPRQPDFMLFTDEVRVKQVMINLLYNALKFTSQGSIEFGFKPGSKSVNFYVKDSGPGIPKNIQKSVFDRFSQGNIDNKAKLSGTGLGLAISKGIVELLGGKIGLLSEENKGSEFFFDLPVHVE
ncbi:MAG: PAS domain S-box protein [Bacteroidales bacterium]|nr:PAS domain S-box protein [Bacteroidales bacterium]